MLGTGAASQRLNCRKHAATVVLSTLTCKVPNQPKESITTMPAASEAQLKFINSLAAQRTVALSANPDIAKMKVDTMAQASALITVLKALPTDPDPSLPPVVAGAKRHGTNGRAGICTSCNNTVAPNEGYWYMKPAGGFGEHHKAGACPEAKPVVQITEGFWKYDVASYVKVYMTQNGRLGGKVLTGKGDWVYTAGSINTLRRSEPVQITPQDMIAEVCIRKYGAPLGSEELRIKAAEYGTAHSACMFCARPLNDERSDPALGGAGYGPDCAAKYGLPWGNVKLTK